MAENRLRREPTLPTDIKDVSQQFVDKDVRITREPQIPSNIKGSQPHFENVTKLEKEPSIPEKFSRGEQAAQRFADVVSITKPDNELEL